MRQQFMNLTGALRRQASQDILEISKRIMPIELGTLCRSPNYAEWAHFSQDSP